MILPRLANCLPHQSNSGPPSSAWAPAPTKQAQAFAAGLGVEPKGLEPVMSHVGGAAMDFGDNAGSGRESPIARTLPAPQQGHKKGLLDDLPSPRRLDLKVWAMRRLALAVLFSVAWPLSASAVELTVNVNGIRNAKGDIRLAVYGSPQEWPDNAAPGRGQVQPAKVGSVTFKFDLPPGVYAINGFHDEIGNGKFKKSLIGLPEEGYLFSNNVRPFLSAPSFNSASFRVPAEGTAIAISVQYP